MAIATQGEECLTACTIYHNMGGILFSKGDFAAAKPFGEKAAAYAAILDGLGRYDESEAIYRRP